MNIIFREEAIPYVHYNPRTHYPLPLRINSLKLNNVVAPKVNLSCKPHFASSKLTVMDLDLDDVNNIFVNNFSFPSVKLNNPNAENIVFNNVEIADLTISNFVVKENVRFLNINLGRLLKPAPKEKNILGTLFKRRVASKVYTHGILKIENNSLLGGMEVNPSILHHFESIELRDSSISGLKLPSFKPLSDKTIESSKRCVGSADFFRELQKIMLEQSDKHYATIYRAIELELKAKSNDGTLGWFDRQVLNLNYWSNVHGTQPFKALIWIFLLIVCHIFLVWLSLRCESASLKFSDFLLKNYSYYFKPITFLSDIESDYYKNGVKIVFNPVFKFLDFVYKVFYAYLLYQFIAAFRKFNG